MSEFLRNRTFNLGFLTGLIAICLLNYFSYLQNRVGVRCADCGWRFGFPFDLYQKGGFISFEEILWLGLIGNILTGFIFSFSIGLIFKFVRGKFTAKDWRK